MSWVSCILCYFAAVYILINMHASSGFCFSFSHYLCLLFCFVQVFFIYCLHLGLGSQSDRYHFIKQIKLITIQQLFWSLKVGDCIISKHSALWMWPQWNPYIARCLQVQRTVSPCSFSLAPLTFLLPTQGSPYLLGLCPLWSPRRWFCRGYNDLFFFFFNSLHILHL